MERRASALARLTRAMRSVDRQAIHLVHEGASARIVGRLRYVGEPLVAPVTGRRCAYYELRLFGAGGETYAERALGQDFEVEDDTGVAVVAMSGAVVSVTRDSRVHTGRYPDREGAFAGAVHELRYEEGVLDEGATVAVVGRARWGDAGGYRHSGRSRLVLGAPRAGALYVTDQVRRR